MATYNTSVARPTGTSFVRSENQPSATNDLGGPAFRRDARSELWLLAIALLSVSGDTFHERADTRVERFKKLVRAAAVADAQWVAGMLADLRQSMNMRTASIIGAAEFVKARRDAGLHGLSRQVVASVLQRADEPGELIAYWTTHYGRRLPMPLKRGIADALPRLYDEYGLLKYDSAERGWRFADVIELTHPRPRHADALARARQSALWRHAIDRRHNRIDPPPSLLAMIGNRRALMALPVAERRPWLLGRDGNVAQALRAAGMTWEAMAGWMQAAWDAATWTAILPAMPYMAKLRNLRNFDAAGVPDSVAERIAAELADPVAVARSRQFPFRFLSAYRAVAGSLRWAWPLEKALNHSLANVPQLAGRSLILVDRSPSMWDQKMSKHSDMDWADGAALFGAALALRAEHADLVEFGFDNRPVAFSRGESVLALVGRFGRFEGTDIPSAIRGHLREGFHDRVIVVTDEQTRPGHLPYYQSHGPTRWGYQRWTREHVDVDNVMPKSIPLYLWNFGGYEGGATPTGTGNRHTFGGLTDAAFRAVPLIERGAQADWPWAA